MGRPSTTMSWFNTIVFLLSVPILAGGIWLSTRASRDCERFLERPLIAVGVALMFVSLVGAFAACCGVKWLVSINLLATFLLLCLAFGFTVFAFVVTYKGAGDEVSGRGYMEYKLKDGNNWLQKRVKDDERWMGFKACLLDSNICQGLQESKDAFNDFVNEDLSPTQSGCCKPPYECGFIYRNATRWDAPSSGPLFNNSDCTTWSNNQSTLCYDCQSCKAGIVANLKADWKKVAILNIVFISFLAVTFPIGCLLFIADDDD